MATGLEMLGALRAAIKNVPSGGEVRINRFDALDLCQLKSDELTASGWDETTAERIVADLKRECLSSLGCALGIQLNIDRQADNLIPGEGLRRSAGAWKDDPEPLEEMLQFFDDLRHPQGG